MKVNSFRYRKNRELAQFKHEHAEVEVAVGEGESFEEAVEYAKFLVAKALGEIDEAEIRASAKYMKFLEK